MCLSRVDVVKPEPEGEGYKVFSYASDQIFPVFMGSGKVRIGEWLRKGDGEAYIQIEEFVGYPTGFHIFECEKDAIKFMDHLQTLSWINLTVRKVKYRRAHTRGMTTAGPIMQSIREFPTIVADEMFVIPEEVQQ